MYPNLYYLIKDVFGVGIKPLKVINSFGFVVAICFLLAAVCLIKELKRKQKQGWLTYTEREVVKGAPASFVELLINFILGFLLGYKILGVFFTAGALNDPQAFIFSKDGNWYLGIALGLFFSFLKWKEKNREKLTQPQKTMVRVWPSDRVGDMTILAAVAGFAGAKIFDNLENWDRFVQDPIGNLFSPSGLTFYGGLIVAAIALWLYFRKHNIRFLHMADANAPGLMLAYGLGRLGCQLSGDGDWGILNSAYISDDYGKPVLSASPQQFNDMLTHHAANYSSQFGDVQNVPHASLKAFWGLPDWLFAYTYPHNVIKEGVPLMDCTWDDYCNHLALPVFPTPIYEIVVGLALFAFLWRIRKKINIPGRLFAIYLFVNGIERFLIEQIRVNTKYKSLPFQPTQAELIALLLIISGVFLYWYAPKMHFKKYNTEALAPSA